MTLPYFVVHDSPDQVQPVVVIQEVSKDFLKQKVRTLYTEYWEVHIFLWRGHVPPHASELDRCPTWGLSVPVPFSLLPLFILFQVRLLPALSGLMALLLLVGSSGGGGVFGFVPLRPPSPLFLCLPCLSLHSFLCLLVPCPLGYLRPIVVLPGFGHYVGRPLAGNKIFSATMSLACSSGVPFPPNGVGVPSLTLVPILVSPLTPSPSIRLTMGGRLLSSWGLPRGCPPSPVSERTRRMCAPAQGVSPSLIWD